MDINGSQQLEMAEHCFKLLKMAGNSDDNDSANGDDSNNYNDEDYDDDYDNEYDDDKESNGMTL